MQGYAHDASKYRSGRLFNFRKKYCFGKALQKGKEKNCIHRCIYGIHINDTRNRVPYMQSCNRAWSGLVFYRFNLIACICIRYRHSNGNETKYHTLDYGSLYGIAASAFYDLLHLHRGRLVFYRVHTYAVWTIPPIYAIYHMPHTAAKIFTKQKSSAHHALGHGVALYTHT